MGNTHGIVVKRIWEYSDRTLTQSKFPFWNSVSPVLFSSQFVSSNSAVTVTIRPPQNKIWFVLYQATMASEANKSHLYLYAPDFTIDGFETGGTYSDKKPHLSGEVIIDYDNYIKFHAYNSDTQQRGFQYGYSVFELGTRRLEIEILDGKTVIRNNERERKTKYKVRTEFEGLEDLIFDIIDDEIDGEYRQVIYFYKDKAIRRDKQRNYVFETASSYIETDKLIENLQKIKTGELELEKTGYKEWLDRMKKERGIDLLGRL